MNYGNICPLKIRDRQSRAEYQNKLLLITIMMQLAFAKNDNKHLWHNRKF